MDTASEAVVSTDWVDSREALEARSLLDLVFLVEISCLYLLIRVMKRQSGERFKCSSLLKLELLML
jgi:hypothetical protein